MTNWKFPSRCNAETEGLSNAALAEFKGKPLKALAREICQNSLDATDKSGRPVRVEFHKHYVPIKDFPGMDDIKNVILSCENFWGANGDQNTKRFISNAKRKLSENNFFVLQISDYNTTGVLGAFRKDEITPWGSLVKGNAFSVKVDQKNAAGSFGIGKAAPFVSSFFQTVFYRTLDTEGIRAALGVSRLMAHKSIFPVPDGEDPVRRSVGYYGEDENNYPATKIPFLDKLCERNECGTDLFIPGFTSVSSNDDWIKEIFAEILDNFLYSIYSGKLEVVVENRTLSKSTLSDVLIYLGNKAKDAKMFYKVLDENAPEVTSETFQFYDLGELKLNLLFANDLNKKVLVVRNSGMKIARIPSLPRSISFVGFLEIKGDKLNEFFRGMENPKHDAWEPNRYDDPDERKKAKKYKSEVEDWVKSSISKMLLEYSGDESPIDMGDCLNYQDPDELDSENKHEAVIDTVKSIEIIKRNSKNTRTKILDTGGSLGQSSVNIGGLIDDKGNQKGHRHRTGRRKNATPAGRLGHEEPNGLDRVYAGMKEVYISARIINRGVGINKLIFTPEDSITNGLIDIVTKGENGKSLKINVISAFGNNAHAENGRIIVAEVPAKEKQTIEFEISEKRNLSLGVRAYGNQE